MKRPYSISVNKRIYYDCVEKGVVIQKNDFAS